MAAGTGGAHGDADVDNDQNEREVCSSDQRSLSRGLACAHGRKQSRCKWERSKQRETNIPIVASGKMGFREQPEIPKRRVLRRSMY